MNFSQALELVKSGKRIARSGWNGKGMYVAYQPGYPNGIAINANTSKAIGQPEGTVCKFAPYLIIKGVSGDFNTWVPSISDLMAEDWTVAE